MMLTAMTVAALSVQSPSQDLSTFLRDRLDFSNSDVSKIERGDVVVRKLDVDNDREVTVVGVVRLEGSQREFIERFRDVETFGRTEELTEIGTIGAPPTLDDLAELRLSDDDLAAMRSCRSGDCDLKLSAARIAQLRAMDWETPGHQGRMEDLARSWLFEYVQGYLEGGNSSLVVYDDRNEPQLLEEGFRALLAESPYVYEYVPEFHHYLEEYPDAELAGAENFLYWAVQDVGLKPITSVTHATIHRRPPRESPGTLIALKQIYASHYFHAALSLLALVDAEDGVGVYLIYLDRSLFDTKIGWLQRGTVEGRMKDRLEARLEAIQRQLG